LPKSKLILRLYESLRQWLEADLVGLVEATGWRCEVTTSLGKETYEDFWDGKKVI